MIRGWLGDREKRGYGQDREFMAWAAQTAERAKETLIHLLRKYQIQPFHILEILAHSIAPPFLRAPATRQYKMDVLPDSQRRVLGHLSSRRGIHGASR
jgi:hypothetical protein